MSKNTITYFRKSYGFFKELEGYLKGKKVLEIFSGNGFLAKELSDRGIEVKSTSLFSGHDGHANGMNFEVEELSAVDAVTQYGQEYDFLLMSWPVVGPWALEAIEVWGEEKPVIYIGEAPRPELPGLAGLPGCASDEFFESITWEKVFSSYQGNILERAGVIRWSGYAPEKGGSCKG